MALVNHLGFESVHLLGHSMGGMVAQDMAVRYPGRIGRLILAATSSANPGRNKALFGDWAASLGAGMDLSLWFRNIFYWIFTPGFFENQAALDEALRYALDYPYPQSAAAFRHQVEAIASFDCTDKLSDIKSPTLVIAGKEDLLFPPDACAGLARRIPKGACSAIDHAAHSIHMEQSAAFADHVMEFLRHG
jgi:pimeloyl-ACP methyl ester carboxylesterase